MQDIYELRKMPEQNMKKVAVQTNEAQIMTDVLKNDTTLDWHIWMINIINK